MSRITNSKALTALAVAGALALSACGGGGGSPAAKGDDKPVGSLKFYNDKGGWKDAFTQVGAASKKDIGVGMEPVGYSDSNTYTAFIRSSFRTKEKTDLFSWHVRRRRAATVLAGDLLVSLPTVILFLAAQRFFSRGLALGQF